MANTIDIRLIREPALLDLIDEGAEWVLLPWRPESPHQPVN